VRGKKAKRLRREAAAKFSDGSSLGFTTLGRRLVKLADGTEIAEPVGRLEYTGFRREYKRLKKESNAKKDTR
jgi:hypothetical protein